MKEQIIGPFIISDESELKLIFGPKKIDNITYRANVARAIFQEKLIQCGSIEIETKRSAKKSTRMSDLIRRTR